MAISIIGRGFSGAVYGSSASVSAFTPTADSLLVVHIWRNNPTAISSISGHGTWSLIDEAFGGNRRLSVYGLITSSSPTSSTVTVNWPSNNNNEIQVIEYSGVDISGGISSAIVQSSSVEQYNGGGGDHDNTITLAAFQSTSNYTGMCGQGSNATPEAGYTAVYTYEVEGANFGSWYLNSQDTTPTFNTTQNFNYARGVAYEVAEASGGALTLQPSSIVNTSIIPNPAILTSPLITPSGFSNNSVIENPTILTGSKILPSGLVNTSIVSQPTVLTSQVLSVLGINNVNAFGSVSIVEGTQYLVPVGIDPTSEFGIAEIKNTVQFLNALGINNNTKVGNPIILGGEVVLVNIYTRPITRLIFKKVNRPSVRNK